jgi:hypothetical protein
VTEVRLVPEAANAAAGARAEGDAALDRGARADGENERSLAEGSAGPEGLQVLADGVEHGVLGVSRLIRHAIIVARPSRRTRRPPCTAHSQLLSWRVCHCVTVMLAAGGC